MEDENASIAVHAASTAAHRRASSTAHRAGAHANHARNKRLPPLFTTSALNLRRRSALRAHAGDVPGEVVPRTSQPGIGCRPQFMAPWSKTAPRALHSVLLERAEYAASTDAGAALRHDSMINAIRAFPYVTEIRSCPRPYLAANGQMRTGHDLEIELTVSLDTKIGGSRYGFQVADGGAMVLPRGSNEWWQGEPDTVAANKAQYDQRPAGP
jgi:hypothetical protein